MQNIRKIKAELFGVEKKTTLNQLFNELLIVSTRYSDRLQYSDIIQVLKDVIRELKS